MDLRLRAGEMETSYWTVLSDVMTSMFFLVVLYVLGQHIKTFAESAINERLAARQREISIALQTDIPSTFRNKVTIDSIAPDRQKLTFNSDVLFGVCRAELTDDGKALLVAVVKAIGPRQRYLEAIDVVGHTDRVPTGNYGCHYATNWELSSARATSVVRLMRDSSSVSGSKLAAIGRAEFHPVSGNTGSDPASYAKNRRIEIILQYDRRDVDRLLASPAPSTNIAGR